MITWNTGPALLRARHNLKLKNKKKKQQATSSKPQASSSKRHEKDIIK